MIEITNTIGFTNANTDTVVYSKLSVLSTIAAACFKSEFKLPVKEINDYTNQDAVFLGCAAGVWFKAFILPESLNMMLPEEFMYAPFGWLVTKNNDWLEPLKRVELAYDTAETLRDESNRDYLFIAEHYEKALSYLKQSTKSKFTIDMNNYYGTADVNDRINYRRSYSERESQQLELLLKDAAKTNSFIRIEDFTPFAVLRLLKEQKIQKTENSLVFKLNLGAETFFNKVKRFFKYFTTQQFILLA